MSDVKYNGGPAFPYHGPDATKAGITMRDYFAAVALQGFTSTLTGTGEPLHDRLAQDAYKMADAMLAERNKGV